MLLAFDTGSLFPYYIYRQKMATGEKILVVEDDFVLKDLYVELLTDEGYEVDSAVDGEEGLEKIQRGGWDLVLLDIILPKIDGLQIMERIKKSPPKEKNGPVVFLTNLGNDQAIKKGLSLGGIGYLIKSQFTPPEVLHEVRTFLAKSKDYS